MTTKSFTGLGLRPGLEQYLRCPGCRGELEVEDRNLRCVPCGLHIPVRDGVPFAFLPEAQDAFLALDDKRQAKGAIGPPRRSKGGAYHWETYGFAGLIPPVSNGRALLHGCGDGGEREPLEALGYDVAGFDVKRSSRTDFLADAHQLPVADESFDLILSTQVFEHLAAPWVAAAEIARALKPGGRLVGSVAFLKPFHNSYFHISHQGMVKLLEGAGLTIDHLSGAQSLIYSMYGGMMPGSLTVRRAVLGAVDQALMKLRAGMWSLKRRRSSSEPTDVFDSRFNFSFRDFDKLRFAPAVVFRAVKEAAA